MTNAAEDAKTRDLSDGVVQIGYASHGGGSIPIWVGVEAGIFKRHGVEVEALLLEGTPTVVDRLEAGELHFANIASPPVLEANLRGRTDIVYLTGGLINIVHQLIVRPDSGIEKPTDLRGRTVGIRTSKGGGLVDIDAHLISSILPRIGLRNDEVKRRPIGHAHAKAVQALEAGEVDGVTLVEPYAALAESRGLKRLVDSFELKIPFQLGGLVGSSAQIGHGVYSALFSSLMVGLRRTAVLAAMVTLPSRRAEKLRAKPVERSSSSTSSSANCRLAKSISPDSSAQLCSTWRAPVRR